jgi:tetratricopeptide (TPR) repeat protein/serine/threonine protein kinase
MMQVTEGNLATLIAQGPLPPDLVRSVVRQVLAALTRLHQNNRIHGGVRPANIHMDAQGNVKLSEPSASLPEREHGSASVPDRASSPAKYLAPELLKPEFGAVGPALDLYCLGFTALELLKGPAFDALFPGVGPDDIDVEIAWTRWHSSPHETLPSAGRLIPDLPKDLADLLDRLLKKNVADRYPSARAAMSDLDEEPAIAGNTIRKQETATARPAAEGIDPPPRASWQTVPSPPAAPTMPPARASRFGVTGILAAALLAIVLVPTLLFFFWPAPTDKIAVIIASEPPRAKVFIDNRSQEKPTDSTLEMPPGQYTLRLELEHYEPFEGKISINEHRRVHKVTLNKIKPVTIPQPTKRTLIVQTNPPGADVYINDHLQDKKTNGSFQVKEGPVTLKLVHKGLPEVIRKIDGASALAAPIEVVFDRKVTLRSEPPGATFILDGKELKSPDGVLVQPGKHKVKAELAGYAPEEKTIDVAELFQEERFALHALPVERHALLIGVRQALKNLSSFVHAESDVETLGRTLRVGGFKPDKVSVLTQTRGLTVPDELPSAVNIRQRLNKFAADTTPADVLVVALVGHTVDFPGVTYFVADGASQADPSTLVSLSDVLEALRKAPARKKLLILDCWRKNWSNKDPLAHVRAWNEKPPAGATILYGCSVGQTGYEHTGSWHSAFNQFLVQGLLGEKTGPKVSTSALADFCRREVSKMVAEAYPGAVQVPELAVGEVSEAWTITSPGETTADYLLGCAFMEKEDYDKALEAFDRAELNLLSFPEFYLRRADARYNKRQFEGALADCGTALNLDSNNAAAYAGLAEVQRAAAKDNRKADPKDYAEALKNIDKAMELDPGCALAFDARGTIYYSCKALTKAIKDYTEAARLQPRLALAWGNIGLAQSQLKQWDDAIAAFDKAIDLIDKASDRNKRYANPFAGRGTAWSMKGNADQAVKDFTTAIQLDRKSELWNNKPPYKEACYNLGTAYVLQRMYPSAVEVLNRALKLDPNYVPAQRLLNTVQKEMKDGKKARTDK